MAKKRVTKKAASRIAEERMSTLADISKDAVRDGKNERAVRYVFLARKISQKTRTPMPEGFHFCKKCNTPLIPGRNCRVRLSGGRIVTTCERCNSVKRMPYSLER
jgi:ribonuclease P protein subunit RPR2